MKENTTSQTVTVHCIDPYTKKENTVENVPKETLAALQTEAIMKEKENDSLNISFEEAKKINQSAKECGELPIDTGGSKRVSTVIHLAIPLVPAMKSISETVAYVCDKCKIDLSDKEKVRASEVITAYLL